MENLIKGYLEKGVYQNKIIVTTQPSVCIWSTTRKCLVNENGIEALEVVFDKNGNSELTFKNNKMISLQVRSELTKEMVDEINNSNGIIITDAVYGQPHFRYGFIPI